MRTCCQGSSSSWYVVLYKYTVYPAICANISDTDKGEGLRFLIPWGSEKNMCSLNGLRKSVFATKKLLRYYSYLYSYGGGSIWPYIGSSTYGQTETRSRVPAIHDLRLALIFEVALA